MAKALYILKKEIFEEGRKSSSWTRYFESEDTAFNAFSANKAAMQIDAGGYAEAKTLVDREDRETPYCLYTVGLYDDGHKEGWYLELKADYFADEHYAV